METSEILYKRLWYERNKERTNAKRREQRRLNPEPHRQEVRLYRLKDKQATKERRHQEYLRNKETYRAQMKRWYAANRERYRLYTRQYARLRNLGLGVGMAKSKNWYFGAKCWLVPERKLLVRRAREELFHVLNQHWCQQCGYHDKRALQFDHINGGGTKEHKQLFFGKRLQFYMYYALHPELARKTLQVLCCNCNYLRRFEQSL